MPELSSSRSGDLGEKWPLNFAYETSHVLCTYGYSAFGNRNQQQSHTFSSNSKLKIFNISGNNSNVEVWLVLKLGEEWILKVLGGSSVWAVLFVP
jgi:hypothetical protein